MQNKKILLLIIFIGLMIAGLYIFNPVSLKKLSTVEGFVEYAHSFGMGMPLAIFVITVLQALIPVVPFIILCSTNALLFGLINGTLLTWLGTLIGASIMFYLSRAMGYEWVFKKYDKINLKFINDLSGLRGFWVILTLRLMPYFPAPLINMSAGVSGMEFFWFLLASAIGKLPFIIGYGLMGYSLLHSKNYTLGLVLMVGLLLIPYLISKLRRRPTP